MTDLASLFKDLRQAAGGLNTGVMTALATTAIPATPRRRAAVLAHDGYGALETYQAVRPQVFYGSVAVALGATGMAWWRRRHGTEAIGSWGALAALAGVVAYLTRPSMGVAQPVQGASATDRAYRWLDARAAYLDRTEPGWEDRIVARVTG